ncbi:MAG: helicase [Chitinivibrionales bacterium]|nr:helicase [Chitinivibrionales bacterium]
MNPANPLIVQSNNTLFLEVNNDLYRPARDAVGVFAHLEKSPEFIHTYSITPLSLWNAASLGLTAAGIIDRLETYSKYPVPPNVKTDINELVGRYGKFTLESFENDKLLLKSIDADQLHYLTLHPKVKPLLAEQLNERAFFVPAANRGILKQCFIGLGYPVQDLAGYVDGDPLPCALNETCRDNESFTIREYQRHAAESFVGTDAQAGGSGVVVLPCGAGKTIVGLYVMSLLQRRTLILATGVTAARQWREELIDKTSLKPEDIGEYSGETKEIKPVTIATYQILTFRKRKKEDFIHFGIFNAENWGLIIYDEVHLLPAPVFKFTAEIQARRRLGLTATLIREDGHEADVFSLIGPKKFDVPWKDLEKQGWIATARCREIRIDLPATEKLRYLSLTAREQIRTAYENPNKLPVVRDLLKRHLNDRVLIMGQYLDQLHEFAREFEMPIITGSTPNTERSELYQRFKVGQISTLILSKVGNFAVDLPDANVAIQISGSFGSRQEEAQRLGRILRPKKDGSQAIFYSIVTRESKELDFAMKRQLFLAEQGYSYEIQFTEVE